MSDPATEIEDLIAKLRDAANELGVEGLHQLLEDADLGGFGTADDPELNEFAQAVLTAIIDLEEG